MRADAASGRVPAPAGSWSTAPRTRVHRNDGVRYEKHRYLCPSEEESVASLMALIRVTHPLAYLDHFAHKKGASGSRCAGSLLAFPRAKRDAYGGPRTRLLRARLLKSAGRGRGGDQGGVIGQDCR